MDFMKREREREAAREGLAASIVREDKSEGASAARLARAIRADCSSHLISSGRVIKSRDTVTTSADKIRQDC